MPRVNSIGTLGASLLTPGSPKRTPPVVHKPKPTPPNTTVATQWDLYSMYPPGPEWPFTQKVPVSQEVSKGYDVEVTRMNAQRRWQLMNQANGQLLDGPGGYTFTLFVQRISMDMSLTGSRGQSQYTRDFYPRNFVQPSIAVTGQSPSQEDYGMLCEYIHACQHKAVANGYQNLTQLYVAGRNSDKAHGFSGRGYDGNRTEGTRVMINQANTLMSDRLADPPRAPKGTYFSQTVRGAHQPLLAKGYISQMPRIHQQFQGAVQWTFVFTIAAMLKGPFQDTARSLPNSAPTTWLSMLQDIQKTGVTTGTPALLKRNAQIVRAASAASINPLTPNFNPSGASSAPGGTRSGSISAAGVITDPAPGAKWGRLDMGFDGNYDMSQGAVAPYSGIVHLPGIGGWPGQGTYFYIVNDDQTGPDYTRAMYFAEGATPSVTNGQHVTAGQKIGSPVQSGGNGTPGNFEIGPAQTGNGDTLAKTYGLNSAGARAMVNAFAAWLQAGGAGTPTDTSAAGGP